MGVDLFFVLSGFLVSGLLFREQQQTGAVRIGRFLIRRGFKIYPAFYCLVAVSLLERLPRYGLGGVPVSSILAEVFFVQNYHANLFRHTWSLAVEEHFYFGCALLIYYLTRRGRGADPYRAVPAIFAAVAVICLALRIVTAVAVPGFSYQVNLFPTHLRLDGLMFGVCLSYVFHYRREVLEATVGRHRGLVLTIGLALILPAFVFDLETTPFLYTVGFAGIYLGCGMILTALVLGESRLETWAPLRPVLWMGTYSYSIYLWHTSVRSGLDHAHALARHPYALFAVYIAASLGLGALMSRLLEMPVLHLRDRLSPALSAPPRP